MKITFGPMEKHGSGNPGEMDVFDGAGNRVGVVEQNLTEMGLGMTKEYRVCGYTASLYSESLTHTYADFDSEYYGGARKALSAAKEWIRQSLK